MFKDKRCANHPSADALSFCHSCRQFFCAECLTEAGDYYFCGTPDCVAASQRQVARKERAIRAAYAVGFCDECIDATEPTPGGKSFVTFNGIGVTLCGRKNPCPRCNSAVATAWFCIFFIPFFPLARYRVAWLGPSHMGWSGEQLLTRRLKRS
jgi:hypothetical protein